MAAKHPYVTGASHLSQTITQFRKSFPATVNADTLKKLGIATNNESYVLNVLRFLKLIDQEGKKTSVASKVFTLHTDEDFAKEFEKIVRSSYPTLYELQQEEMWSLDRDALVTFFRSADESTEPVGKRQARTFELLAAFSGHGEFPDGTPAAPAKNKAQKAQSKKITLPAKKSAEPIVKENTGKGREFGLTVRIEINLPSDGDQETYDRIFKSIREHFIDG